MVGPAGGETGVPRCLAEVRKLLTAALFHRIKGRKEKANFSIKNCQTKKKIFYTNLAAQSHEID